MASASKYKSKEWWTSKKRNSSKIIAKLDALKSIDGERRTVAVVVNNDVNPKNGALANRYAEKLLKDPKYKFISSARVGVQYKVLGAGDATKEGKDFALEPRKLLKKINNVDNLKTYNTPKKSAKRKAQLKKEMDDILNAYCSRLGEIYKNRAVNFILEGGNHVYQPWKDSSDMNLYDTGTLVRAINWEVRAGKTSRQVISKGNPKGENREKLVARGR